MRAWLLAPLLAAGCTSAPELGTRPAESEWSFASDYNAVSECLVRTMNQQFLSLPHRIITAVPGKTNHVAPQEGIPWTFNVYNLGPKQSSASAHMGWHIGQGETIEKMTRAATDCGGAPARS